MNGLVGKRAKLAVAQTAVVLARDPPHEEVRVKCRRRRAAKKITVCHIHYDCCRALSFEAHTHEVLQMMIQCDLHVRAGGRRIKCQLAHGPAAGVDLHPLGSRLTAQRALVNPLDRGLADLVVRRAQKRIWFPVLGCEIAVADGSHIADLMGKVWPEGIDPGQDHLRVDTRKRRGVQGDD